MVYDAFLYHGEENILRMRLEILDKVVDKFVLVEARKTFKGDPCPLFYQENKRKFEKWNHKIIHHVLEDFESDKEIIEMAQISPNTEGHPHWMRVFYSMESLRRPLELIANDEDTVIIGDIDEIWNPDIELPKDDNNYRIQQIVYAVYLNNRSTEPWLGSVATKWKNIRTGVLNHIKHPTDLNGYKAGVIENGGWHFTYQGGMEEVIRKLNANPDVVYYGLPREVAFERLKNRQDLFGRDFTYSLDEESWPQYLKDHREEYQQLCLPKDADNR